MNKNRSYLLSFIIILFLTWLICPWNNSSAAAKSFNVSHAAHGHSSSHEEDTHHDSKGDHGCITPISFSKEDTSIHGFKLLSPGTPSIHPQFLEMETHAHPDMVAQLQLTDPYPARYFIPLYQLYSVYLL